MKRAIRNILGVLIGIILFRYVYIGILLVVSGILNIPFLGDVLRMGRDPIYIVFGVLAFVGTAICGGTCYFISAKSRKGNKPGMLYMASLLFCSHIIIATEFVKYNGYDFAIVIYSIEFTLACLACAASGYAFNSDNCEKNTDQLSESELFENYEPTASIDELNKMLANSEPDELEAIYKRDPDYTKLTEIEREQLEETEKEINNG